MISEILREIDELENEKELKEYLESLSLSVLLDICYKQECEINRIRKIILESANKNH